MKNVYLYGYWQSERYFIDFADAIRQDFTIKTPIPQETKDELHQLQSMGRPLVMMGVRRYQECKGVSSMADAACRAEYYLNAMAYVRKKLCDPLFVIFSQDHEWIHSHLQNTDDTHIVNMRSGSLGAISDLFIMTHCHHAIISNSTYYWWGAWLQNPTDNHIVVVPNNFFNRDSICEGWTVINN